MSLLVQKIKGIPWWDPNSIKPKDLLEDQHFTQEVENISKYCSRRKKNKNQLEIYYRGVVCFIVRKKRIQERDFGGGCYVYNPPPPWRKTPPSQNHSPGITLYKKVWFLNWWCSSEFTMKSLTRQGKSPLMGFPRFPEFPGNAGRSLRKSPLVKP